MPRRRSPAQTIPVPRQRPPVRTDERLPPPLIESPAFVLMQAGQLAHRWISEGLEPLGITATQYAALSVLNRLGAMSQVALAERLGMSEVAMTELAAELQRRGFAQRQLEMRDLRRRLVAITREGAELLAEAADEVSAVEAECLEHVDEAQCRRLAELAPEPLSPIEENLRKMLPRPA
jgi:DNA-binding MarR family transcriptional regulator